MAFPGDSTYPGGDIPLVLVGQDESTWTFGWDGTSDAGYRFSSEVGKRSHTWNPDRQTVRFAKGSSWYRVEALTVTATGTYRP